MGSACGIHLHANFLHFPVRRALSSDTCTACHQADDKWGNLSELICPCLCDCLRASEGVRVTCEGTGGREEQSMCTCVALMSHLSILTVFFYLCLSNLICFSSGHQENFSICDFKLPPSVPLAPWGNTSCLTFHLFFFSFCFVLFCNSIMQQRLNWFAKQAHKNSSSLKKSEW